MEHKRVHFVGIGGIGMSALAQLYVSKGITVSGSDRSASNVTTLLESKGVQVHIGHTAVQIGDDVTHIVYSDAVPEDNPERVWARNRGIQEQSYFEALGKATQEGVSIVVSGTHGKTSTTAMIAKILIDAGKQPTVIAGSILTEYGSNFVAGRSDLYVIEGCEYRRHFLHLHPNTLVITNIELDHTDYFTDLADMQDAFTSVVARVEEGGVVVANTESETVVPVVEGVSVSVVPYQSVSTPALKVPGEFNVQNAQAAKRAVQALSMDIPEQDIDASLATFTGTWRRFEYKGKTQTGALVYDDYAHHPTAVRGTIQTAKEHFPGKQILVVFHPHLYSRTKTFFDDFVRALCYADEVVLLPIFAAREKEDLSVSSEKLARAISENGGSAVYAKDFDAVKKIVEQKAEHTLILTMGAGDVYKISDEVAS